MCGSYLPARRLLYFLLLFAPSCWLSEADMYGITDLMSQKEKTNIRIMTTAGVRNDGRGCLDARPVNLEVAVMPDCYGSARVRIGRTDVLATVRAEFSVPNPPGRRGAGPLDISVDLRGIGGEGRSLLFRSRKDALEDYSYLTCKILERMYNTYTCRVIRDSRLEIIPGQLHWLLHVDVSPVERVRWQLARRHHPRRSICFALHLAASH